MSERAIHTAISSARNGRSSQRGVSVVTIAVVLAALAAVTLTIVQAATSSGATTAQAGIPGLVG